MGLQIYYDGLNLALQHGTGIATYTRMLMNYARDAGHSVGAVYAVPTPLAKNAALREISFYDPHHAATLSKWGWLWVDTKDQIRSLFSDIEPVRVEKTGIVITDNFSHQMPIHDSIFAVRGLFGNANWHFRENTKVYEPEIRHPTRYIPLHLSNAVAL